MKNVSLFRHVNASLNPYRWILSLTIAIIIAGSFAAISLESRLNTDKKLAKSLSPYLVTLVESSDRPELMRVVNSISEATASEVVLVQDSIVFASSRSFEEIDRIFVMPKTNIRFWDISFNNNEIITSTDVRRSKQSEPIATVFIISPLLPSLQKTIGLFLVVFLISVFISIISAKKMKKAVRKSLLPLDQLHSEIKDMISSEMKDSTPIQIRELEEIRSTVRTTKIALDNAKDQLAEAKAKKLSSDAYKRLIHDLHNPVSALRQMAKLANDTEVDEETKFEAASSIPRLADQILNQVTSAKKNLEEEPIALRELDIIDCVQEGVKQMQSINLSKAIVTEFDLGSLSVPHDPALLKRAVVNLLENGLEAAKTKVRVSVTKKHKQAFIRICDDGNGMDENLVPIYLQGRGQSGKANRQAFGLSSTNHIVRSHGGKLIYRKSELGGSSFEIRLEVV